MNQGAFSEFALLGIEHVLNPFDDAPDFAVEQLARHMHNKETV